MSLVLPGNLLIAAPAMTDETFARTVVLILQHSKEGTFGVVLNRPADESVENIWKQLTGTGITQAGRFSVGGPMSGPIFALHQSQLLSELPVTHNVYLSAEARTLTQLSRQSNNAFRIFLGISGWEAGQLEEELNEGQWYLTHGDADVVFHDSDSLWEQSLRRYGKQIWRELLGRRLEGNPNHN